jgi:hypothetical protein
MNTKMVAVACKLPHGLLVEVGTPGQENYARFEVAGPYTGVRTGKAGGLQLGGYAFTMIPEDAWKEFERKHKGASYLKNRNVFSEESLEKAHAAAMTEKNTLTGLERLNPDKPAPGIEPDKEHLKQLQRITP